MDRGRLWTEEEEKIVAKLYGKASYEKIANNLPGRKKAAVKLRAKKLGLVYYFSNDNGHYEINDNILQEQKSATETKSPFLIVMFFFILMFSYC